MEFKGYLSDKELQMILSALNNTNRANFPYDPRDKGLLINKLKNRTNKHNQWEIDQYCIKFNTVYIFE